MAVSTNKKHNLAGSTGDYPEQNAENALSFLVERVVIDPSLRLEANRGQQCHLNHTLAGLEA